MVWMRFGKSSAVSWPNLACTPSTFVMSPFMDVVRVSVATSTFAVASACSVAATVAPTVASALSSVVAFSADSFASAVSSWSVMTAYCELKSLFSRRASGDGDHVFKVRPGVAPCTSSDISSMDSANSSTSFRAMES